ncbi:hypothetical protein C4578_00500 [Candidatus Microgenomates bacterium]|jgi:hypothetical protein|nr:MAG: hypothetical protein C4578_00500 [Candidatus Microgenomates bacterium]
MLSFFKKNRFILFVLASVAVLRIPSLFEPYWYGDEGIYLTLGMGIKRGLLLYRDIFDNKPPLIYLLTALADGRLYWFRSMLFVSCLASIYFFFLLSKKIINSDKAVKVSVLSFALFTTIRFLEGNIANAEIFILLPAVLGYFAVFKEKSLKNFIFSGLLFSTAFLFKVPALFDFAALSFFLIFLREKERINLKEGLTLFFSFLLPIFLVSAYFILKGAFSVYFNSVFLQTIGYLSSWETGSHVLNPLRLLKSDFAIRSIILLFSLVLTFAFRKKLKEDLSLATAWFLFALYGASLSGRPYPHYLIQVIPGFSLLLGIFVKEINQKTIIRKALPLLLFAFLTATYWRYQFWAYETFSYYRNFIDFSRGKKDKTSYFNYFNPRMTEIYLISEFIKANTNKTERVFVWADESNIYPLSQRLPATPYAAAYHVSDLKKTDTVLSRLENDKISLIIKDVKKEDFLGLEILLKNNYRQVESIGDFVIFRKKGLNGN